MDRLKKFIIRGVHPIIVSRTIRGFYYLKNPSMNTFSTETSKFTKNEKKLEENFQGIDFFTEEQQTTQKEPQSDSEASKEVQNPQSNNTQEDPSTAFEVELLDFESRDTKYLLDLKTDQEIGGLSTAEVGYCEETQSTRFLAYIDAERKEKMMKNPFVEMLADFSFKIDLQGTNAFRVLLKKENKDQVVFKLRGTTQTSEGFGMIVGFIAEETTDWVWMDIPYTNLLIEGLARQTDEFLVPFEDFRVDMIGFSIEGEEDTAQDLRVKKVLAVYDPHIGRVNKLAKRKPFFFRTLSDYSSARVEDIRYTGGDRGGDVVSE